MDLSFDRVGRHAAADLVYQGTNIVHAHDAKYRAWGAFKEATSTDTSSITTSGGPQYDSRLLISSYKGSFDRYADGNIKFEHDGDHKFDRVFHYDNVGRMVSAKSGKAANQDPALLTTDVPFDQGFGYNEYNEMQSMTGSYWSHPVPTWNLTLYPQTKDVAGNVVQEKVSLNTNQPQYRNYTWDAAGRQVQVLDPRLRSSMNDTNYTTKYDGDGQMAESISVDSSSVVSTTYEMKSTVLGGETVGKLVRVTQYTQLLSQSQEFTVPAIDGKMRWSSASGYSYGGWSWEAPLPQGSYGYKDVRGADLDDTNPYTDNRDPILGGYPERDSPDSYGQCTFESLPISCSLKNKFAAWDAVITQTINEANARSEMAKQQRKHESVIDRAQSHEQLHSTAATIKPQSHPETAGTASPASVPNETGSTDGCTYDQSGHPNCVVQSERASDPFAEIDASVGLIHELGQMLQPQSRNCISNAVEGGKLGNNNIHENYPGGKPDGTAGHDGIHVSAPLDTTAPVTALPAMAGTLKFFRWQEDAWPGSPFNLDILLDQKINGEAYYMILKDIVLDGPNKPLGYGNGKPGPRNVRIKAGTVLGQVQGANSKYMHPELAESGLHVTLLPARLYGQFYGSKKPKPLNWFMDAARDPKSPFRCP